MREIEEVYKVNKRTFIYVLTKDKQDSKDCFSIFDQHDGTFPKNVQAEEVCSKLEIVVSQKIKFEVGKVLIVDDDSLNIFTTSQMVQSFGFPFITAQNGKEAVEYYQKEKNEIGFIFIDNNMPVMDGPTAIKKIRELQQNSTQKLRKCIIIMLSGDDSEEYKRQAFEAGADIFKCKPLSLALLEEILIN